MDPTALSHTELMISGLPYMIAGSGYLLIRALINDNLTPREQKEMLDGGEDNRMGPNSLDKERSLLNDDPKWLDTTYVLANYKTEPCKKPPRLCRQGYACPQFHNNKDRRRSPKKYKYRSTPCPAVKTADEWGDPVNCDTGDNCQYCHTRYTRLSQFSHISHIITSQE